jgi:hypothetical protein
VRRRGDQPWKAGGVVSPSTVRAKMVLTSSMTASEVARSRSHAPTIPLECEPTLTHASPFSQISPTETSTFIGWT